MPILLSLLLVIASLWSGLATIPTPSTTHPSFFNQFNSEAGLDFWRGHSSLIFLFDPDLHPRQCGDALISNERTILVAPYTSKKCQDGLKNAHVAILQPAGLRLLWSLMPESDRNEIGAAGWEFAQQFIKPFANVLHSPYFKEHYGIELSRRLQDALRLTWMSPRIQTAWLTAVNSLDPVLVDRLLNHLWPIAVEKTKTGLLDTLTGIGDELLRRRDQKLSDSAIQESLTGKILRNLLADPRSQAMLIETLLRVAADPRTANFANLFASEMVLALINDPNFPALVDAIAMDPFLLAQRQPVPLDFNILTQVLPRKLLRYRYPRDHNALVAYLVRSIIRGKDTYVVLFMTDAQVVAAAAQNIPPGIPLTAMKP